MVEWFSCMIQSLFSENQIQFIHYALISPSGRTKGQGGFGDVLAMRWGCFGEIFWRCLGDMLAMSSSICSLSHHCTMQSNTISPYHTPTVETNK